VSGLETADALFGAAERHHLLIELDRLCRRRALLSSGRIPSNGQDLREHAARHHPRPAVPGRRLIDFLDKAQVSPDRIVLEITEKLVIENYHLFREAMAYFTDLGMSFAVDDVGAATRAWSPSRAEAAVPEDRHRPGARRPRPAW
jgi:EAL domain-containing protein (putative c-di-GMP-specific phosphodiesterase class I)